MPVEKLTDVYLSACAFTSAHETRLLEEIRLNQETGECVHIIRTLHTAGQ